MGIFQVFIKYNCPETLDEVMTTVDCDNFFIDDHIEDNINLVNLYDSKPPFIKVIIKKCSSCGEIHIYNISTEEIII